MQKDLNKNNSNKKGNSFRYQDYLLIEQKPVVRSFEVYDVVINYFKFMSRTFNNSLLLREILNELLINYGETLLPNSFEIYWKYMNEENFLNKKTSEDNLNILKKLMIEEKKKNDTKEII